MATSTSPSASLLATPQIRGGPTSRLLKRRSQLESVVKPIMFTENASLTRTLLDASVTEVASNAYSYHSYHSATAPATSATATENLYVDFMAANAETRTNRDQLLDQVSEYENLVDSHVADLRRASAYVNRSQLEIHSVQHALSRERNTWRLLGRILALDKVNEAMNNVNDGPFTERTVVESFFERDWDVRRAQAVVDWLEQNSRDDDDADFKRHMASENVYGDAVLGWENTLHEIRTAAAGQKSLLDRLDPDARRRLGKEPHELDKRDEQRLVKLVYMCVRAGMLDRAQSLCVEVGQPWRAATLVGWQLEHDQNLFEAGNVSEEKLPLEGNPRRDLWKRMAWALSTDKGRSGEECAVYSALCGNAAQLIGSGVCSAWECVLWARAKSMVDVLVEKELRSTMPKTYQQLPDDYWANLTNLSDIMQSLRSSDSLALREDMETPFRKVQAAIILQDWAQLFELMSDWAKPASEENPQLLRFLCHLSLTIISVLGDDPSIGEFADEAKDNIVESYVLFLMATCRVRQVAWYVSLLKPEAQIRLYAKFLETVDDQNDQLLALKLGFEVGLPMQLIRHTLVNSILCSTHEDAEFDVDRKIRALDWLLYEPQETAFALRQANAVARYFIAEQRSANAKEALLKVKGALEASNVEGTLDPGHLKEYDCLRLYVRAKEEFADWFDFYHQRRPKPEEDDDTFGADSYTARVARDEKSRQLKEQLERWQDSLLLLSKDVTAALAAVLEFPGGWCVDESIDAESLRGKELEYLRRTCIVESVLLLHTVLHDTKQYKKAVELADTLAAEETEIYHLFSKEDMRQLLAKIRESSMALVEERKDPWGYAKK